MSSILKVDTIQNTGGTTGLTIDSSGAILKPVLPYGQFSGPSSVTTGGNVITFAGNIINGGGMTVDSSNSRMIVPVAGLYAVGFNQLVENTTAFTTVYIRKNGNQVNGSVVQNDQTSNYGAFGAHRIIELAANDYIDWYCSAGTIYAGSTQYSNHYIYLLG